MTKRYNFLTRCLAALALLFVYIASTSAILVGTTTSPAQARGGGRGGGRGFGRGGGGFYRGYYPRGYGYYGYGGGCYWSYRWGRYICPY